MEKINIDRKITKRADEFAEREYECGADERAHLSKGYYWGYKDAQKDLALTWEDVSILITIYEAGIDNGDYRRYNDAEWMKEYSQDILRRFNEIRKK